MRFKKKPCAYCGKADLPCEKGHVIPKSMYPTVMDPKIRFPTVPECPRCKKLWQDAENQFRNIMVVASSDQNPPSLEQWHGQIRRSFSKPSGRRWFNDLLRQMVPVHIEGQERHMLYPANDPQVMLVARKIVRRLCDYHGLGTAITDRRVFADLHRISIPHEFYARYVERSLGDGFCQYAYSDMRSDGDGFHSSWLVRFYGRCTFIGIISTS